MREAKSTHMKHLPNVMFACASQNYISGDRAVNQALEHAARCLKVAKVARLVDARAISRLNQAAALRVWKSTTDQRLLTQVEDILAKLHPFEGTRSRLPEGNSEDSIIVAAFSPVSRLQSEHEMRQIDLKLTNLTRLLEIWRGKLVTSQQHSVSTQTSDSLLGTKADLLRDSLPLQDLEDRKLESLLAIEESYEFERTNRDKSAGFADISETEFIGSLPDREDPSSLLIRLKSLERQLLDRENRLIQLTKTTHHELELLIQEREQIARERVLYSNLEDIRLKLATEAQRLEARSRAIDSLPALPRDTQPTPDFEELQEEKCVGKIHVVMKWMQGNLMMKPHTQKMTKNLAFNVWKAAVRRERRQKINTENRDYEEKRQKENYVKCEKLHSLFRCLSTLYLTQLRHFWSLFPRKSPISSFQACLFSHFKRSFSLKTALLKWKDFSTTYENKLLRSHLALFDLNLQQLQLQEKAQHSKVVIAQSQVTKKIAEVTMLLEHYFSL